MLARLCAVLALCTIALASSNKSANQKRIEQCLWYYQRGENFDLTSLQGEMNAVYFWPSPSRLRDSCEVITFEKILKNDLVNMTKDCEHLNVSSDEAALKARYKNNAGKMVNVVYFGNGTTKSMFRSCDRDISTYLFIEVDKNFVLGINCSAGGRGVLLARYKPSKTEVQNVVDSIDIMSGRTGGPDCP